MPTAAEITDPHLSIYVPPPKAGPGVCRVCHGSSGSYVRCWSCNQSRKGLPAPLELIVPISLTRTDLTAQLHNVLRDYKWADNTEVRVRHRQHIAAILLRFLARHSSCITRAAGRSFDTITIVPSKSGRAGVHPLEQAIDLAPALRERYVRLLEPGPGEIKRNQAVPDGFTAIGDATGKRVLLVDDTLTSGAKLHSAAAALASGGADVVAGLVLGRVIDVGEPDRFPEKAALWERQSRTPFTFDTCCLEQS